jgi:hypothetical protein
MKTCNWLVVDYNNKMADIIRYIKDHTERLSEDRMLNIIRLKKLALKDLYAEWQKLPNCYKSQPDNLGGR